MKLFWTSFFSLLGCYSGAQTTSGVVHYEARIQPILADSSILGVVSIYFYVRNNQPEIELNCGSLIIDSTFCAGQKVELVRAGKKIKGVACDQAEGDSLHELKIYYHGKPQAGIKFFENEVYTVYSTNEWMPCADNLLDKATLNLSIIADENLKVVGSGELSEIVPMPEKKLLTTWKLKKPVPPYTFGFAIGAFQSAAQDAEGIRLQYFSSNHSKEQLRTIFKDIPETIRFFEWRSGCKSPFNAYSQVLVSGSDSQEMEGFCVLWSGYGAQVLANETEFNLAAHELAHQWWGNHITCQNWNHFWLNEGLAVFMSSAAKEYCYGKSEYLKDIAFYRTKFESVPDKPLQYEEWKSPKREDRIIVYFKGAYVFHLLREELGENAFWEGIRIYSQSHFEGAVSSADLQAAMECASGKDLSSFFRKWVY